MSRHIYPYKAESYIREAEKSFERMKSPASIADLKAAFHSFLNATRFCTQQLVTNFSKVEGFEDWWAEWAVKLDEDELCKFFKKLRNDDTKKGRDIIRVNFRISSLTTDGPIQIGSEGILRQNEGKMVACALRGCGDC